MVIFVPPAAPMTARTLPLVELTMMVGVMDDKGRLPGSMKLTGLGGTPYLLTFGVAKSSIASFRMMPVSSDMKPAPKL